MPTWRHPARHYCAARRGAQALAGLDRAAVDRRREPQRQGRRGVHGQARARCRLPEVGEVGPTQRTLAGLREAFWRKAAKHEMR